MSETNGNDRPAAETPAEQPAPGPAPAERPSPGPRPHGSAAPQRRRGGGVAWLALLLAAATAGWTGWTVWQQREAETATPDHEREAIAERLGLIETRLATLEETQQRLVSESSQLRSRLADNERIHRSLREEVLGVSERAGLLEDAVARLGERRLEGQAALRLDEAESLLRTAHQRQRLFQDRDGALAALRLADAALAGIESSQLINLRQTLRREIALLEAAPTVDRPALARRLNDLRGMLPRLPEARPDDAAGDLEAPTEPSLGDRIGAALSRVISVRRIGPDADLERFPADARRASLSLEIELLRAALAGNDDEAWQRGVERLGALLTVGFDERAPELRSARALVGELAAARLVVPIEAPELTLRELRNLRSLRTLGRSNPAPLPSADDGPAADDEDPDEAADPQAEESDAESDADDSADADGAGAQA